MFCKMCGSILDDNMKFCPKCGAEILSKDIVSLNNTTSGMSYEDLTRYVKSALELEQTLYTQESTLKRLARLYDSLGHQEVFAEVEPPKKERFLESEGRYTFTVLASLGVGFLTIMTIVQPFLNTDTDISGAILLIIILIIAWLSYFTIFKILSGTNYEQKMREYRENYQYEQYIISQDINRVQNELMIKPRVLEQRNLLYNKYRESKALLEKLYSLDIIFVKYRNLVALCSFYEYLASRRCTTLTGHEGAYNIYENEIRLERVVDKLDVVIEYLEEIRDNQHMLHEAITQCNDNINELTGNVQQLTSSVNYAANQTAIAAQNSRWAASELNTIKWLNVLKY